ncbi:hypothetical protein PMZ80_006055 [Knufia obscura]|uniref:Uncharacterized protein n=2 Tax=Knufia TaxID=430999 RepID=A0AAN8I9T7_9EURO|nr:hypothetical protein PMZ80_006055 [Knufia obscura]KAK5954725.1 hypothetical protein OHC33_004449 [Knufia fluminis]
MNSHTGEAVAISQSTLSQTADAGSRRESHEHAPTEGREAVTSQQPITEPRNAPTVALPKDGDQTIDSSASKELSTESQGDPLELDEAWDPEVDRFTHLTGATDDTARKYLHQSQETSPDCVHFNSALKEYFDQHDHEDDPEYVYGPDGCYCLETASQKILDEITREAREELCRDQVKEGLVQQLVRKKITEVCTNTDGFDMFLPALLVMAVDRQDLERVPSMHKASYMRFAEHEYGGDGESRVDDDSVGQYPSLAGSVSDSLGGVEEGEIEDDKPAA